MLLIPYQARFNLRSLPLVTLVLVAVNLIVYLAFQTGDSAAYQRAADFYFSSSLPTSSVAMIARRSRCCARFAPDRAKTKLA